MRVKDLMTSKVISLSSDMTVWEAMSRLSERRITGLPVIDEDGKLAGMMTEKEFLLAGLPSYYSRIQSFAYLSEFKPFEAKLHKVLSLKVREVMRTDVTTVNEDCPIVEAALLMVKEHARRIVVLRDGRVAGIIARSDIVKAILIKEGVIRRRDTGIPEQVQERSQ